MAVDPLHDDELGFGRDLVLHLIRLLHTSGGGAIQEFDARYVFLQVTSLTSPDALPRFRQVPTFGRDTIRCFGGSVSALKKRAGRDFEDILQASSPSDVVTVTS